MARGEIIIPTEKPEANRVIQDVCETLTTQFGGHSRYEGTGEWDNGERIVRENHIKLSVSHDDIDEIEEQLRAVAQTVKSELNEDAVMIETVDFNTVYV